MDGEKNRKIVKGALIGVVLLLTLFYIDILIGMSDINIKEIINAFINFDGSKEALIIRTIRTPRGLLCIIVGAAMSMSGLMVQNITRNPIASPQVLGINAGAALTVVSTIVFFPEVSYTTKILMAFIGAGSVGLLVNMIGYIKKLSPLKVTLVGICIQMFLSSITRGIMLLNENKIDELVFWTVGAVHKAQFKHIQGLLPWFIVAVILGISISKGIDTLKLGDALAVSLGENIRRTKFLGIVVIILLTGSAVAVAGPISFIGLITPHLVKRFNINSFSDNFILCGIYGANLLLLSDIISKLLKYPYESPVGIVTSFIGAIFYIILANKTMKRGNISE